MLHFGQKENSKLLKIAGKIMAVFAFLGLFCTSFFYFKYYLAGEFNSAYPRHHMMKGKKMGMMKHHGMGMSMKNLHQCMERATGSPMNQIMMKNMNDCMMQQMKNEKSEMNEGKSHH